MASYFFYFPQYDYERHSYIIVELSIYNNNIITIIIIRMERCKVIPFLLSCSFLKLPMIAGCRTLGRGL